MHLPQEVAGSVARLFENMYVIRQFQEPASGYTIDLRVYPKYVPPLPFFSVDLSLPFFFLKSHFPLLLYSKVRRHFPLL